MTSKISCTIYELRKRPVDATLLVDPFTLKHGTVRRVYINSHIGYQLCDIAVCLSVPMQKHEHSQKTLREMPSYGHVLLYSCRSPVAPSVALQRLPLD